MDSPLLIGIAIGATCALTSVSCAVALSVWLLRTASAHGAAPRAAALLPKGLHLVALPAPLGAAAPYMGPPPAGPFFDAHTGQPLVMHGLDPATVGQVLDERGGELIDLDAQRLARRPQRSARRWPSSGPSAG